MYLRIILNDWVLKVIGGLVGAYLIGSISFSWWIGYFKGIDLTRKGSGNLGATNVGRVIGKPYGVLVFTLDFLKGWGPTFVSISLFEQPVIHVLLGLFAILGHTFPIFHRFKGGKGAATGVGVLMALSPKVTLILVAVVAIVIFGFKIVSVGTLVACILAPILIGVFGYPKAYLLFVTIICIFIIFKHKDNIRRLLSGQENRF
ncbi:acyl-phosphate glycerol 3-phosphate acyltransferase [Candidatus Marinamargulisbacteria bacterium SCGC AG-439-L15]|nr:acyl-phosphate glycerol 3-phosphate acyltransferase [Candidatus Marinamargulisbacteria bacterium SCGC AG-439-L15]